MTLDLHLDNATIKAIILTYQCANKKVKEHFKKLVNEHNESCGLQVGAKVLIVEMIGEPNYSGKCGIIEHIDDIGQLHGTWGGCALIPEQDTYLIID